MLLYRPHKSLTASLQSPPVYKTGQRKLINDCRPWISTVWTIMQHNQQIPQSRWAMEIFDASPLFPIACVGLHKSLFSKQCEAKVQNGSKHINSHTQAALFRSHHIPHDSGIWQGCDRVLHRHGVRYSLWSSVSATLFTYMIKPHPGSTYNTGDNSQVYLESLW